MHILHVTLGFLPALTWGGPAQVVYQNARELVRRGHRVTVYCTNLLDKKSKIKSGTFEREMDGMRIVYFRTWNISWWPGTLGPIWLPDLAAYLKREISNFDVVHLNGYRCPMMLLAAKAARNAGIPFVTQPHGSLPVIINSFWVKRIYDWLLGRRELKGISALIASQNIERSQALARAIPDERVLIIPNGIAASEPEKLPEPGNFRLRFGLDLGRPLILFLGRLSRTKGADMLIRAFAGLEDLEAQLAIVGPDDGQLAVLKSLIKQFNLHDRVTITGLIGDADKTAAYHDADLFVLPSRYDAFPTTLLEACRAGIPMVISDRVQSASLVRDRVAKVVPFDAIAFAGAMRQLLMDRGLYQRYRDNCRAVFADTFSLDVVGNRLELLYRHVIAEREKHRCTNKHGI